MTDTYLLLTPLIMLVVVALVGFVGCHLLFNLEEVPPYQPPLAGPQNLKALAGDNRVDLTWDPYSGASIMRVYRSESGGPYDPLDPPLSGSETSFADTTAVNGIEYCYHVKATVNLQESAPSNEECVTPGLSALITFVTSESLGMLGNYGGWVGMGIQVGTRALTVRELGRYGCPGNNAAHRIKIVDAVTKMDVPNAFVDITIAAADIGTYKFGALNPVVLNAGAEYYIISEETATGDQFYGSVSTSVMTTGVCDRVFAVNGDGMGTYATGSAPGFIYGPMNFKYNIV